MNSIRINLVLIHTFSLYLSRETKILVQSKEFTHPDYSDLHALHFFSVVQCAVWIVQCALNFLLGYAEYQRCEALIKIEENQPFPISQQPASSFNATNFVRYKWKEASMLFHCMAKEWFERGKNCNCYLFYLIHWTKKAAEFRPSQVMCLYIFPTKVFAENKFAWVHSNEMDYPTYMWISINASKNS